MKKLSNLKGAKALNRQEQKSINGGKMALTNCTLAIGPYVCPTTYPYYCERNKKCCTRPCN